MLPADIIESYIQGVKSGEKRLLSRVITFLDNNDPRGISILEYLYSSTVNAHIIGITGPPGVGKSTLIAEVAKYLRKQDPEAKIAILSIDPSSPFSGGSILGDRIRMNELTLDDSVFIRSLASRGYNSAISKNLMNIIRIMDLWVQPSGMILIETVGSGQADIEIMHLVDSVVVILNPGFGDDIQASKAGMLEIADIFVINKADLGNSDRLELMLQQVMELSGAGRQQGWIPPIIKTSAQTGENIEAVARAIKSYLSFSKEHELLYVRRKQRVKKEFTFILQQLILKKFYDSISAEDMERMLEIILKGKVRPIVAAENLLENIIQNLK